MNKIFTGLLIILMPAFSHAQLNNILNRTKNKIDNRVNSRIDKEIDKKLDEVEGKPTAASPAPAGESSKETTGQSTNPVGDNKTKEGKAQNRRVEFVKL